MSRVPKGTEYIDDEAVRRIFARMNELGMKRVELCRELGYANGSYVSRLEKGEIRIQKPHVVKWADALQTTPEYILGETDEPTPVSFMSKNDKQINKIMTIRNNMTDDELKLWIKIGHDIINARKE